MLIDWFTVCAQALNFIILVWLLKRFLYKPILGAIDAREKKIAAELADADSKRVEAQRERDDFCRKSEELDQRRAGVLKQATDEAKEERRRLFEEARLAADAWTAGHREKLRIENRTLYQAVGRRMKDEVFAIARKTLADLATTTLEERLAEVFARRLRDIDLPAKAALSQSLRTTTAPALVRSTFDLAAEQRSVIRSALNETFSAEVPVRFETAPELVAGIELTSNGQKLAWTIADYLGSMQTAVGELLDETEKAAAGPEAKPKRAQLEANGR